MGKSRNSSKQADVAIIMGSDSDLPTMREASKALDELAVSWDMKILSAHRTPDEVADFAKNARKKGYRVIIAGAGGAAHLPGMTAAWTDLPVVGVPVPIGVLQGVDALHSIVQMPKGVPVATVAIGNAWNAGVLAAQIIGATDDKVAKRLASYKDEMRRTVLNKKI
jgi:phosphoribosylaminoimidazole carboxylase PurE protein